MQDKTTVHETTYAQNNSVALKKKKRNFTIDFTFVSLSVNSLHSLLSKDTELHQWGNKKEKSQKTNI